MITESLLAGLMVLIPAQHATVTEQVQAPVKVSESLGMKITAQSALVVDEKTKTVLFEKNAHEKRAMASITKVMTVLVALESDTDLQQEVVVDPEATGLIGAKIKLEPNEKIRLEDLLKGALISSGNDAALAIAYHVGDGDPKNFVEQMNLKAAALGLESTQFKNPHGLDEDGHYSNTVDIVDLLSYAMKNPKFKEIAGMVTHEAHSLSGETVHHMRSTNRLLRANYSYMVGGKTGYTDNAGFCLASMSQDTEGNEIMVVVLGSDLNGNQFQDSKSLIEWTFNNYSWK